MRLKLDENLSHAAAQILREAGHDASTVTEERIAGMKDMTLIAHRLEETQRDSAFPSSSAQRR